MKISPNTLSYPIMGETHLTPSHKSIATFNQMISSKMDYIELALYDLVRVVGGFHVARTRVPHEGPKGIKRRGLCT
jgi:hypothetical protein